ncbi:D-glutamate cyclase, mitochondrial-like [Pocillopora verrucosa]|uniref:D-glutamate cyclase, mitochondrial-like n=1 Tax=Pocillopora verrucosa TaxID=203993 RepID=UPI003341D411
MAISGHGSQVSLRNYISRSSREQVRACSDILSEALSGRPHQSLQPSFTTLSSRAIFIVRRIPPVHADTKPRVVTSKDKPFTAPLVSESAVIRFRGLEREIQDNIGERGIAKLHNADELLRAALVLSRSSSVGIHFGFPCNTNNEFPDETDDPLGAIALGKDLKTLGKEVTFIASYYYVKLVQVLVETFLGNMACVVEFTPSSGRTEEGRYMSMKARDLSDICKVSPVDEVLIQAKKSGKISTVGIGDGGNEIGMGKVHQRVVDGVTNGRHIATRVSTDHLITSGVSSWGGSALVAALAILNQCPVHSPYVRRRIAPDTAVLTEEVLNTVEMEEDILKCIVGLGVCDGILQKRDVCGWSTIPSTKKNCKDC